MRVAAVSDFLEEGWPSMNLVAEMLLEGLQAHHGNEIEAILIRPRFARRLSRASRLARNTIAFNVDRLLNRFVDYPRLVQQLHDKFDVFHVLDHSYGHLVNYLPRPRTVVTCHDLDTFRSVLDPGQAPKSLLFRAMTRRILNGLQSAAKVVCNSSATREEILSHRLLDAERLVVVRNGVHSVYSPKVDPICDERVSDLIGRPLPDALDLLHVASTIPRKRIDLLLRVFAAVRKHVASARLIRVGGNFTNAQQDLIEELEIGQSIVEMPHLERRELAALYRRATILLMPSEAEGFGFPVVEALASGTPVVASDLPALREVGGTVVKYCGLGKIDGWSEAVLALAAERLERPRAWRARSIEGVRWAERFSSREYASGNLALYRELHASAH